MAAADDALDSVSSHTIDILRVSAGMRAAVIARLIDLEGELSSTLARAEDLSANKYAKLNALLKQTTAQIIDAYSQIDGVTKEDLKQLVALEGKQAVKIINGTIGADVVSVALSPKQLEAIVDAPVIFGNSSSKWWEAQAEDLRAKFAQQMQQGLLLGEGIDELARRVRGTKANGFADGIMDKKKREADALVRSSVISTANEARLRTMGEMSDLVKGIQWVATLDNRTTPICRALDGKVWRLPDFEPVGHDKKWPGPTAHWNCFTGDVPVSSLAGVRRFYRRPYSGELLTVETNNGRRITATPNHPVLTREGWKPVGELKAGDELICQKGRGGRVPAGSPQDQSEQASFAEFGQTFAELESVFAVQVPVTGPDFHGDVAGAEVCEVWTDRRLCGEDDAALAQLSGKPLLDDGNLDSAVGLTCEGGTLKALASADGTADGSMGRGDVRTLAARPSRVKIVTSTAGNASGDAPTPESVQADSILPGDFSGREFVGDVESDSVRMIVRREAVSVLVHNLETETGWYFADGIVAHNCRSTQIPVLRSWEELSGKKLPSVGNDELQARLAEKLAARGWSPEKIAQAKANTRASMDGQEAKATMFDDWLGKKDSAAVDRLLGPGRAKLWKEGKVTVSDLTNQNNRPLTLAQLANKIERGIPAPETLGQDFLPLPAKPKKSGRTPAPEHAPAPEPELSREDMAAKTKLAEAAATKLHQKLVGEVLAANPDASPAVQWAVFQEKKLAKEVAISLNDDAAMKTAAGVMPAKVKTILNKLADDDPAKVAFADKVKLAKIELASAKALTDFTGKGADYAAAVQGATKPGLSSATILAEAQALLDLFGKTNLQNVTDGTEKAHIVLKTKAKALLKAKPDAGYEDWLQVQAEAKAAIAAANSGALLAGAAKNLAAGKKLSPGQQAAVDALDEAGKNDLAAKANAIATSAAAKAAAAVATGPDLTVQNLALDGPDTSNLTFLKSLPGSTAPGLYRDETTGKEWVLKKADATSLAHVENEALADAIYRAAGARVPFSTVTTFGGQKVKAAEFLPGGTEINTAGPSYYAKAREHFVLDALMGNWDAVGTGKNNLLVVGGEVWRIDNGGALLFRAMGYPKDAKWLTPEVQELKTLLNPNIARDASDVYRGITQDEINRQILDVLNRRDRILAAAASNPKVRDLLESRLDWLATQLPAGMQATAPPAAAVADIIPPDIERRLRVAKRAGVQLDVDGPDIEDNNVLVWRERAGLKDITRAQLKVTPDGSRAIMEKLKAAGADMTGAKALAAAAAVTTGTAKNPLPQDSFWQDIKAAAGNIAHHAGTGQYNPSKVAIIATAKPQLQALAAGNVGEIKKMAEYYLAVLDDLAKAMAKGTKPTQFWNQYEPTPAAAASLKPTAPPPSAELAGWTIKRADSWESPTGTPDAEGVIVHDGGKNPNIVVGQGYELTKGAVTVNFAPRRDVSRDGMTHRSKLGVLDIKVEGQHGPAAISQALAVLDELGIRNTPTTDDWRELLYLHKGFYITGRSRSPQYVAVWNDASLTDAEKVNRLKDMAEKEFGVKLPRDKSGWGPNYNPAGELPSDGTGYRTFTRWDLPPSKLEKELPGWQLHHFTGSKMSDVVKGWLQAGRVTSTFDRFRSGVELKGGASSMTDMTTGGAVHFYTNVINGASHPTRAGFRFKIRNLARLDVASFMGDEFGDYDEYPNRVSSVADYKQMNRVGYFDNALLKGGLSFLDEIDEIITGSAKERADVLKEFKAAGVQVLPDGRKVESIVK